MVVDKIQITVCRVREACLPSLCIHQVAAVGALHTFVLRKPQTEGEIDCHVSMSRVASHYCQGNAGIPDLYSTVCVRVCVYVQVRVCVCVCSFLKCGRRQTKWVFPSSTCPLFRLYCGSLFQVVGVFFCCAAHYRKSSLRIEPATVVGKKRWTLSEIISSIAFAANSLYSIVDSNA